MFVSHARTPEELQAEVCSDLQRRLQFLDGQINVIAKSATEQAKLSCAKIELEQMLRFWQELKIIRPRRNRNPSEKTQTSGTGTLVSAASEKAN